MSLQLGNRRCWVTKKSDTQAVQGALGSSRDPWPKWKKAAPLKLLNFCILSPNDSRWA